MSFWFDVLGETPAAAAAVRRKPAEENFSVDVCIIGGGLTALWTAYYLAQTRPELSIAILEKETVGFGASGRNGGWCSSLFPRSAAALEREYGYDAAVAMRTAMVDTVKEVHRVTEREGIKCDFAQGGTITYARSERQLSAARREVVGSTWFGVDKSEFWDFRGAQANKAHPPSALAASFDPHCARVQPAKLVLGLADRVEQLGVRIYEQTEVTRWRPRRVTFRSQAHIGEVQTETVVLATEAYGAQLAGIGRRILPLYSLMIATEPLPESFWNEVGLAHGHTFSDFRHLLIYGQRTADNRFAFGGRGARYHWGSSIRAEYDRVKRVFDHLEHALINLFPSADGVKVSHRWGGPLGVSRDWHASVSFNPATGVAYAGGYVGDGLSTTNLAGRTLSQMITGTTSDLTRLPWVNHLSPKWEPEPLRFIGTNLGLISTELADVEERITQRESRIARLVGSLTGH